MRYHFPRTYRRAVEEALGDWIIYYEPRRESTADAGRGGRQSYFAIARVNSIEKDPVLEDHYYAYVTDYLDFPTPVPFRTGRTSYEEKLTKDDGSTNKGAFGRSVRLLPDDEFQNILRAGFALPLGIQPLAIANADQLLIAEPVADYGRPIIAQMLSRPFRDAAFAVRIVDAYDSKCALTGLKLVNGGGRREVEAAHIRPVEHAGPDSMRNGIALSRTAHWLFDRGLVSIENNGRILAANKLIPDDARRLIVPDGYAILPDSAIKRPHPQFLEYHRQHIFKG